MIEQGLVVTSDETHDVQSMVIVRKTSVGDLRQTLLCVETPCRSRVPYLFHSFRRLLRRDDLSVTQGHICQKHFTTTKAR